MKKFLSIFAVMLIVFLFSCEKPQIQNGSVIRGKLIRNTCVDPVIQILEEEHYSLGESWVPFGNERLIENVFTVNNICDFQDELEDLEEGDSFNFSVIPDPIYQDCAVCRPLLESPNKRLNIKIKR